MTAMFLDPSGPSEATQDQIYQYLVGEGYSGTVQDMMSQWYEDNGAGPASLNDMTIQYWVDQGVEAVTMNEIIDRAPNTSFT